MFRPSSVWGPGVLLLLISASVTAAELSVETPEGRLDLLKQQIAAGEMGPALATARQASDVAERSALLEMVADAQMNTGDFGAALGAARSIPDAEVRDRTQRQRAELQSLNGGNGAQFQQLIDLIQENTEGPWQDIDGIGGTTTWEPNGVRVDPLGLLARLSAREQTGRLEALGVRSRQADLQKDMAQPSELRMVSLTRLERAVSERLASGQPVVESMLRMAGLTEVHYVFVYPDAGEVVIAGPAEGWKYTANGDTVGVESEHPTLQLDDLVTVLRTFSPEGESVFGCSINPRQDGLKDLKQFVETSQSNGPLDSRRTNRWMKTLGEKLGRQDIEIYGVPADSRAARVIVEADYRMKLIGIG
ncbi:MAG: DUF1598 domain-containing protein, partial [Planctomycetaceae bacterium]|nr:DUF1598 domain-containing protein [Planctomycetaceae bacterium]